MYESENEKMEHEHNHGFERYLQEQHSKRDKCVNDNQRRNTDIIDYMVNEENFKDMPNELLFQGKSVIDSHPQVADGQLFIIEPSGQAFLVRVGYMANEKERELTPEEYMIIAGIEKC